jgi:two-component system OmpR family response regulator
MTVAAISEHAAIPASRRAPYPHRHPPPKPALTITLQITVSGAAMPDLASRVVEDIREFAERLHGATVTLAPSSSPPPVGESTVDALVAEVSTLDPLAVQATDGPRLYIEPSSRTVLLDGEPVRLTRREFDLLVFLSENRRRVFSREQLLTRVWGYEWIGGSRTVDVHIRRLRVKLGQRGPVVCTVHGVGYRLDEEVQVTVDRDLA